jgi:hypothetical protein
MPGVRRELFMKAQRQAEKVVVAEFSIMGEAICGVSLIRYDACRNKFCRFMKDVSKSVGGKMHMHIYRFTHMQMREYICG